MLLLECPALFGQDNTTCLERDLGIIPFKANSSKLTGKAVKKLDSLVLVIKNAGECEVLATAYAADLCDRCGKLSWERAQAVLSYLKKRELQNTMVFTSRLDGNFNFVSLALVPKTKPEDVLPHPNLRRK